MMTVVTAGGSQTPPLRPQQKLYGQRASRERWQKPQQSSYGSVNQVASRSPACCSPGIANTPSLRPDCRHYFAGRWALTLDQKSDHARHLVQTSKGPPLICPFRPVSSSSAQSPFSQEFTQSFVYSAQTIVRWRSTRRADQSCLRHCLIVQIYARGEYREMVKSDPIEGAVEAANLPAIPKQRATIVRQARTNCAGPWSHVRTVIMHRNSLKLALCFGSRENLVRWLSY